MRGVYTWGMQTSANPTSTSVGDACQIKRHSEKVNNVLLSASSSVFRVLRSMIQGMIIRDQNRVLDVDDDVACYLTRHHWEILGHHSSAPQGVI